MRRTAAVVGGGPAGLMAAEVLASAGLAVTVFDHMPSIGRKLLMAGRGGLNLTHAEPLPLFLSRYGLARDWLEPVITAFPPQALIDWCHGLGQPTFVGTSARVFPLAMKASPLLRAWLGRLAELRVVLHPRRQWVGWDDDGALRFADGERVRADVTVLGVGGASWPRLGSDGGWTSLLDDVASFRPSNCGFTVGWSEQMRGRFAGVPLKRVAARFEDRTVRGEAMITATGIEGGAIYALSGRLRDAIEAEGEAVVHLDLRPDLDDAAIADRLGGPRGGESLANRLRKRVGLPPPAIALMQEALHAVWTGGVAALVKNVPVRLQAPMPIGRAISSAGGLRASALTPELMLRGRPGVFAAGEMLDWEAPTGGYLLQACFSTGVAAARGALAWLG
jgi:uncharacterized flavoprotein (TIGR03862 family)